MSTSLDPTRKVSILIGVSVARKLTSELSSTYDRARRSQHCRRALAGIQAARARNRAVVLVIVAVATGSAAPSVLAAAAAGTVVWLALSPFHPSGR